jgi:SPP1 family predicted phage head-tail adaptor
VIHIGDLRRRVVLEREQRSADGGGGASVGWQVVATVWAAVKPLSGREKDRYQSLEASLSHRITLRYRAGVSPDMRLRMGARLFDIRAVFSPDERRQWLICLCREIVQP